METTSFEQSFTTIPSYLKASACYLPTTTTTTDATDIENDDYSHLPSATVTAVAEFDDECSPTMFIDSENIVCYGEYDPFIDTGIDFINPEMGTIVAQADVIHEATADEIPTYDHQSIVLPWHECYDAVVVQKEEKLDLQQFNEFSDELLFAEIIDEIAISGFEEEKNDNFSLTSLSNNLPYPVTSVATPLELIEQVSSSSSYYSYSSSDELSETDFFLDDFSSDEKLMTFSIGGPVPKPKFSTTLTNSTSGTTITSTRQTNQLPFQMMTTKQRPSNSLISMQSPLSSPKYPPKPVREREISQQKWKDKRTEKLSEGRSLDARQLATAKRERTNGKFAKRKINWVSITEMV